MRIGRHTRRRVHCTQDTAVAITNLRHLAGHTTHSTRRALVLLVIVAGAVLAGPPGWTEAADAPRSFILRQQLDAQVSEIDTAGKTLRLKTDAGRLALAIPAATTFKKDEPVVLDVIVIRHADPTKLPRIDDGVPASARQHLRGSIAGIQRALGVVNVNTRAGRLTLHLPMTAIAGLRTGDELSLDVAVLDDAQPSAMAGERTRKSRGFGALLLMLFGR